MFIVFDLETTGLSSMKDDIVQFSYIMFDSNNMFVKSETLYFYYEGMSWNQEVADKTHQISLEFLKTQADKFKENVIKLYSVLNRANAIGHNSISFDFPFVKNWLKRQGLVDFEFGVQQDTMVAFRPITKRARIKLTVLGEMFGITSEQINYASKLWFGTDETVSAHDARYDVALTALLTLGGLSKKLITFETITIQSADLSVDVDTINMDDSVSVVSKSFHPLGYYIKVEGIELSKNQFISVCHDRKRYKDMDVPTSIDDVGFNKELLCPWGFLPIAENKFEAVVGGVHVLLTQNPEGDSVTITTPYGAIKDTVFADVKTLFNSVHE